MKTNFICPNCQAKMTTESTFSGRKVRCPKCRKIVSLVAANTPSPDEDTGSANTSESSPTQNTEAVDVSQSSSQPSSDQKFPSLNILSPNTWDAPSVVPESTEDSGRAFLSDSDLSESGSFSDANNVDELIAPLMEEKTSGLEKARQTSGRIDPSAHPSRESSASVSTSTDSSFSKNTVEHAVEASSSSSVHDVFYRSSSQKINPALTDYDPFNSVNHQPENMLFPPPFPGKEPPAVPLVPAGFASSPPADSDPLTNTEREPVLDLNIYLRNHLLLVIMGMVIIGILTLIAYINEHQTFFCLLSGLFVALACLELYYYIRLAFSLWEPLPAKLACLAIPVIPIRFIITMIMLITSGNHPRPVSFGQEDLFPATKLIRILFAGIAVLICICLTTLLVKYTNFIPLWKSEGNTTVSEDDRPSSELSDVLPDQSGNTSEAAEKPSSADVLPAVTESDLISESKTEPESGNVPPETAAPENQASSGTSTDLPSDIVAQKSSPDVQETVTDSAEGSSVTSFAAADSTAESPEGVQAADSTDFQTGFFREITKNNFRKFLTPSGNIDLNQLNSLPQHGEEYFPAWILRRLTSCDFDKNGEIDDSEFLIYQSKIGGTHFFYDYNLIANREMIKDSRFNIARTPEGEIDLSLIRKIKNQENFELTDAQCQMLFDSDINQDGFIEYLEYINFQSLLKKEKKSPFKKR